MASISFVKSATDVCRKQINLCCRAFCTTSAKSQESGLKERRKKPFPVLDGTIDKLEDNYAKNLEKTKELISKYDAVLGKSMAGGGEKAILRHVKQNKKLLATDRVKLLLDDMNEFLELSPIAGHAMEYGDVARAGLITGIHVHSIHPPLPTY